MVINTNTAANNTSLYLSQSTTMLQKALAELSSGSKITSPADDPAGSAVALRLNAEISRVSAANNNIADANSYNQTQTGFLGIFAHTEEALLRSVAYETKTPGLAVELELSANPCLAICDDAIGGCFDRIVVHRLVIQPMP